MSNRPMTTNPPAYIDPAVLRRLAVNESGFVFDPITGRSFTVNESGRELLARMIAAPDEERLIGILAGEYAATTELLRRDLHDFVRLLCEQTR